MKNGKRRSIGIIMLLLFITATTVALFWYSTDDLKRTEINLLFMQQFGKQDEQEDHMFGLIASYAIDSSQNLFVLDQAFKNVKKFSKEGQYICTYGYGAGKGPGELNAPHDLCVDEKGSIYIVDKANLTIVALDSSNKLLGTIPLSFLPAQIIAPAPMKVDVSGFFFSFKGNVVKRFDFFTTDPRQPYDTYCERIESENSDVIERSGNSGRLVRASDGSIFFSFHYPYEIRKYSADGKLHLTIHGNRKLAAPYISPRTGSVECPAGIEGLAVLPTNKLLVLIYEMRDEEKVQTFEFFDTITGEYLGSSACKDLGIGTIRLLKGDNQGNIYLDFFEPYPHIKKYSLQWGIE